MKLLPSLALSLILALGALTACGSDSDSPDAAATSTSEETPTEPETETASEDTSEESEPTEPDEATDPDVISYCKLVATMSRLQKAGKSYRDRPEMANLSDLVRNVATNPDLTDADGRALQTCSAQLDKVYKAELR